MKPVAYEGTEPYIFVSYAHRDSERVFEVLGELQSRGYRFWYDDGIAPGSEWPEDIAQHLDGSAMVIAFVTPNSMKSQNCRREINFSLSREKPFLSVLLEETDMPLGMQMQLSAQQSILRYNYDSWESFIAKILACPGISPCKVEVQPQVELPAQDEPRVAIEPTPVSEEPVQVAVPATEVPADPVEEYHEVEVVPPASEPAPEPLPEAPKRARIGAGKKPAKDPKPAATTTAKKSPIALIAGAAAVLIAIIAAVSILTGSFTTSWGDKVSKGDTYVDATDVKVTQADLQKIVGLKNLQRLTLKGCDLSECDFSQVSFASSEFRELDLSGSTGVKSYAFLSDLPLKHLYLQGQESFDDLSVLDTSSRATLDINGTGVTDLSPLEGCTVDDLDFSNTEVSDISVLSSLGELRRVVGSRSKVTSLTPLRELTKLKTIAFDGCNVGSLSKSFASLELQDVSLADAHVTSLDGLADCTVLKRLNLAGNTRLSSMDWLDAQNYTTLSEVYLARTGLTADGLGWLTNCTQLTALSLDGIALTDLSVCSNLAKLTDISAVNCGIEDVSGLAGCPELLRIYLGANKISDVSTLKLESENPVTLDLTGNQLSTLEGLPQVKYRALVLYANATDNAASVIPDGLEALEVVTPYFDGIESSPLTNYSRFSTVYVVDCPQNQVLKLQEAFSASLKMVSEDELLDLYENDGFTYALHTDSSYLVSVLKGSSSGTGFPEIADAVTEMESITFDIGN